MNLKAESADLEQLYHQLRKVQEELVAMKPGENLSLQSYEVISRLITFSLVEIKVKRLQNTEKSP